MYERNFTDRKRDAINRVRISWTNHLQIACICFSLTTITTKM